jgi:hypothetical protein
MKLMFTLLACLVALATAAPALAGNGQSVSGSIGAVQASSTSVDPAVSVAAPVGASAPVCVASACSTSQSAGQADSAASTTGGGQIHPAGQKVSKSVGAVQVGSTDVSPAVSVAAPVGASAPVCVASGCSASQSTEQAGSGGTSSQTGGQSQTVGPQTTQTPSSVQTSAGGESSRSKSTGSAGSGGAKHGAGSRSAGKGRPNGLFAPTAGRHESMSAAGSSENGKGQRATHPKGCAFSGASAKLNGRPTASGLVPSGGWSLTLLLAIACGLLGFSSLSQWVRSELRRWIS